MAKTSISIDALRAAYAAPPLCDEPFAADLERPPLVLLPGAAGWGVWTALIVRAPVTLLFTDLEHSTALLHRVGDERAQRILRAHRQLLQGAIVGHGGGEGKWLGDGLMATFASVADAVRCAITMQQQTRRPAAGERLGLRIGHGSHTSPSPSPSAGQSSDPSHLPSPSPSG